MRRPLILPFIRKNIESDPATNAAWNAAQREMAEARRMNRWVRAKPKAVAA